MHKVSKPYKEKNRKSWFVRWIISGKRFTKAFNNLDEANMFRKKKYIELNSDVYSEIDKTFDDAKAEYLEQYDIQGLSKKSKEEPVRVLRNFFNLARPFHCSDITQQNINDFIKGRQSENISKWTVNKDIGVLKAFLNFLRNKGYIRTVFDIKRVKAPPIAPKSLSNDAIKELLKRCPNLIWEIRILISLVTGIRAGDVDRIKWQDVSIRNASIFAVSRKTSKQSYHPVPESLTPLLQVYIGTLDKSNPKLFQDKNIKGEWQKIKGELTVTRQQFRVTFSTLIQQYSGIGLAQELLEHYSKKTTETHYSDRELLLRIAVSKLPLDEWI